MKKTFELSHPKKTLPRLIEAAKHEIKKYLKRERRKTLPAGVAFWDFDCKFGTSESTATVIHLSTINQCIDEVEKEQHSSFYIEILAKPGTASKS